MLGITGWKDKQESKRKSERVKAANKLIDDVNGYRGGRPPWGYRVAGGRRAKRIVADPAAAPVITELFTRCAAGQLVPVISAWLLEAHGISKNFGSITATVRRPVYWSGRYQVAAHTGVIAETRTAPIVSKALFDAANAALDGRSSTGPRPRLPRRPDYSGRLWCPTCGQRVFRMYGGDHGKRTRYYYCKPCRITWSADLADDLVERRMLADGSPEFDVVITPGSDHSAELARVLDELQSLGRRNLPDREHDQLLAQLRGRRDELASLPVIPPRRELAPTGRSWGEAWLAMTHAERRAFLTSGKFRMFLHGRGRNVSVEKIYLPDEFDLG